MGIEYDNPFAPPRIRSRTSELGEEIVDMFYREMSPLIEDRTRGIASADDHRDVFNLLVGKYVRMFVREIKKSPSVRP